MCFGDDTPATQTIVNRTESTMPAYVAAGGEDQYKAQQELAKRPYPTYDAPRIADFSDDTKSAMDLVRSSTGEWQPKFEGAFQGVQDASAPVNQADIDRYMDPYTKDVANTTADQINRQAIQDRIVRNSNMSKSGSYLNEDRRGVIDNAAAEGTSRTLAEAMANLYSKGFEGALGQANTEKSRQMDSAKALSELASQQQALTKGDVNALSESGSKQEALDQLNLSMRYDDFLKQFNYPQENINALLATLNLAPYQKGTTATNQVPIAQSNPFASVLGAGASIAGLLGSSGT